MDDRGKRIKRTVCVFNENGLVLSGLEDLVKNSKVPDKQVYTGLCLFPAVTRHPIKCNTFLSQCFNTRIQSIKDHLADRRAR